MWGTQRVWTVTGERIGLTGRGPRGEIVRDTAGVDSDR